MRRAAKVDRNHSEIAGAFVAMGCSVRSLAAVGGGMPDLIVGMPGINMLVEVKDGEKPPSARKLTDDQAKFHAEWRGPVATVKDLAGVETVVRFMKSMSNTQERDMEQQEQPKKEPEPVGYCPVEPEDGMR
jgi:hypothetical protein